MSILRIATKLRLLVAEDSQNTLEEYLKRNDLVFHYAFTPDRNKEVKVSQAPKNSSTPLGVYSYEAKTVNSGGAIFTSGRPWVFVLKPKAGIRLLDIRKMGDLESIAKVKELAAILEPGMAEYLAGRMQKLADRLPRAVALLPGARLYFLAMKAHKVEWKADEDFRVNFDDGAPANPAYSTRLLQKLGYDGIIDTVGLMYSSEPQQVCLFSEDAFSIEDIVPNPQYDGQDLKSVT